jgi:hypothetical protein
LTSKEIIQTTVSRGVQEGVFGYCTGAVPTLDPAGKYQVARSKVRFEVSIAADEVDLESGFIMLPCAIPSEPATAPGSIPTSCGPTPQQESATRIGTGSGTTAPPQASQKYVQFEFTANRDQLFTAWNALANLADLAGTVRVTAQAECEAGFDKNRLENGVFEPLRESNLIQ